MIPDIVVETVLLLLAIMVPTAIYTLSAFLDLWEDCDD